MHHIWSSCMVIMYDNHKCSSCMIIIYGHHVWSSGMIIIYDRPMWSSYMIMMGPHSHVVSWLSRNPCDMTVTTDFDFAYEPDDFRSRLRHLCAPPYHPGSAELLKFRIFWMRCLGHQIHDFSKFEFLNIQKPLTVILTVKFFRSFPNWSDPKRVCPYQLCVSRNPFFKSHMW